MEGIERGSVDASRLMSDKHLFAGVETIHHDSS